MEKYITIYLRDNQQISHEEWRNLLKEDVKKDEEKYSWNVSGAIFSDLANGREVEVNGHYYNSKTDIVYETAKELFEDLIFEGHYDLFFDVLKEMNEEEIFQIVSKMKCVKVDQEAKTLILKDEQDWN